MINIYFLSKAEVNIYPSTCVLSMLEVPDLNMGTGMDYMTNTG
jgi:hypothetical protein